MIRTPSSINETGKSVFLVQLSFVGGHCGPSPNGKALAEGNRKALAEGNSSPSNFVGASNAGGGLYGIL